MIELKNISVSLPRSGTNSSAILKNISLTIRDGEWVTLAGPNGSGKTTLLKTIAGLLPVDAGELKREGIASGQHSGMALLLQEPDNQFVASSVRYELLLSPPPSLSDRDRLENVSQAVDQFELGEFLERNPHSLSGGEKQRLAFATVWLSNPRLLLLDEPTSYLDAVERDRCVRFVDDLNRAGVSVVWATPSMGDLPKDRRVAYIDDGQITFDGTAGEYQPAAGRPRPKDEATVLPTPLQTAARENTSVVLMRNVSFGYDGRPVITDFSLNLGRGECVAVSGRNGSGKSTLLGLLGGVLKPASGDIQRLYPKAVERGRQNLFYLFQSPERLFFAETVFEEIAFGLKALKIPRADIGKRVDGALTQVGLPPAEFRDRLPFSLSLGEMRRLAFAITLALGPRFLLMDEPASCLDAPGLAILTDLIRHFRAEGCTIALASHDVDPFSGLVDRVIEL